MRRFWMLAVLAAGLSAGACNTVAGMGKDVSSAGDAVANAADKHK